MVVERKLGTEDDPDIIESGNSIEVIPEKTRGRSARRGNSLRRLRRFLRSQPDRSSRG